MLKQKSIFSKELNLLIKNNPFHKHSHNITVIGNSKVAHISKQGGVISYKNFYQLGSNIYIFTSNLQAQKLDLACHCSILTYRLKGMLPVILIQ